MSHIKTENPGVAVGANPLFASVWLALFNELRKGYIEPRGGDLDLGPTTRPNKDTED